MTRQLSDLHSGDTFTAETYKGVAVGIKDNEGAIMFFTDGSSQKVTGKHNSPVTPTGRNIITLAYSSQENTTDPVPEHVYLVSYRDNEYTGYFLPDGNQWVIAVTGDLVPVHNDAVTVIGEAAGKIIVDAAELIDDYWLLLDENGNVWVPDTDNGEVTNSLSFINQLGDTISTNELIESGKILMF